MRYVHGVEQTQLPHHGPYARIQHTPVVVVGVQCFDVVQILGVRPDTSLHSLFSSANRAQTQCILDQPIERRYYDKMFENPAPGAKYSVNQQCQFVFGASAEICPYMVRVILIEYYHDLANVPAFMVLDLLRISNGLPYAAYAVG